MAGDLFFNTNKYLHFNKNILKIKKTQLFKYLSVDITNIITYF